MKNKYWLFCFFCLAAAALLINSCKKNEQDNIATLFTGGQWQLASVQVFHYVGSSQVGLTDTLGADCNLTEVFKFNTDKTCTFTNYNCMPQPPASGHWSLSSNRLFLYADMVCQDSTGTAKPFATARIVNLGQYSLVLQTGDLQNFYTPTQERTIIQYGFVRQKTP